MKAIIPEIECFKLYDKAIAKAIETIAEFGKLDAKKETTNVGMYYDGGLETKYILQLMKIYNSCVRGSVTIYIDTSKYTFKKLKKQYKDLNLKRIGLLNKNAVSFIMKPNYLKSLYEEWFSKERFYTPYLMEDIWYAYYDNNNQEPYDEV